VKKETRLEKLKETSSKKKKKKKINQRKDWKLKRPKQESNYIIKTEAHGEAPHLEDFP